MKLFKAFIPEKIKKAIKDDLGVPSHQWSFRNLKRKGFIPGFIVDVGAYEGNWTREILSVYHHSKVLMIEAQSSKSSILNKVAKTYRSVNFDIALLSSEENQTVLFLENETSSHITAVNEQVDLAITLLTKTLDSIEMARGNDFPELLKLDVQGHELEVLKGGVNCLKNAEVCLLEVSLLNLNDNEPSLLEVITFMDDHNFQAYDILQFMRRPYDLALYQIDLLFVKKSSSLIASKNW